MNEEHLVTAIGALIDEAEARLTPKPERVITIAAGQEVAWDSCCQGMLYARLDNIVPFVADMGSGPIVGFNRGCSVPYWLVTVTVGILRCVDTVDDDGAPPSDNTLTTEGVRYAFDMAALASAARSLMSNDGSPVDSIVGMVGLGPMGGCAGGEMTVTMKLAAC